MKIIALFGKSGAGKDTLLNVAMCTFPDQLHKITMTTTRPIRDYETQGKEYNFVDPAEFAEKLLNCDLIEATSFNNWFYGTDINELREDKINIIAKEIYGAKYPQKYQDNRDCQRTFYKRQISV